MSQQFTRAVGPISQVLRVRFDFSAGAPAGTEVLGSVTTDPKLPAKTELTVPSTEVWHIVEVYAESTGDIGVDGYLDLYIDDLKQNLRFGPMSQTLRTLLNPVRLFQAIVLPPNSRFVFAFTNRTAVGASAVSTTITVVVYRIPLR